MPPETRFVTDDDVALYVARAERLRAETQRDLMRRLIRALTPGFSLRVRRPA